MSRLFRKRFNEGWIYAHSNDVKTTIHHELGHRLHNLNNALLDPIAIEADQKGWGYLLGYYGKTNKDELMAESMVLYLKGKAEHRYIYPPLLKAIKSLDRSKK
ncbi:MAG: hypothetical protein V3U71_04040 [Cocleimonas sp.]